MRAKINWARVRASANYLETTKSFWRAAKAEPRPHRLSVTGFNFACPIAPTPTMTTLAIMSALASLLATAHATAPPSGPVISGSGKFKYQ